MSYTVKYDGGEIQDNIDGVIDKPALALSNTSTNTKGEVTTSSVQFTFSEPTVDGESATLIKNNLKLANLNRGAIVLDQDTTESSISVEDELESSTNYQATLTQYADEQIEAYSEITFKTAQEAPFDISTDTITLRQGDSAEISFINDGCSLSINSEYSLVNITQNTDSIGLTAVTNDMGSDHLTITATKEGFFAKTFSITVIVPDVVIECNPLAISIDGDVDEYKDVVVTTNGDDISYTINNDNCYLELLSTSQDGLTKTYRVYGKENGSSIITFNSLVDENVVETCTCGVTLNNISPLDKKFKSSTIGEVITTPSGRYLARHSSGKATVMQYNYHGNNRVIIIADAQFRKREEIKWSTNRSSINGLYSFTSTDSIFNRDVSSLYNQNINDVPTYIENSTDLFQVTTQSSLGSITDEQLNILMLPAYNNENKTARECGDICIAQDNLATYPALEYCRSLTSIINGGMDLPLYHDLAVIYIESDVIDSLDPTANSYPTCILGKGSNTYRWFSRGSVLSAQVSYSGMAISMAYAGVTQHVAMDLNKSVIPIREIS